LFVSTFSDSFSLSFLRRVSKNVGTDRSTRLLGGGVFLVIPPYFLVVDSDLSGMPSGSAEQYGPPFSIRWTFNLGRHLP